MWLEWKSGCFTMFWTGVGCWWPIGCCRVRMKNPEDRKDPEDRRFGGVGFSSADSEDPFWGFRWSLGSRFSVPRAPAPKTSARLPHTAEDRLHVGKWTQALCRRMQQDCGRGISSSSPFPTDPVEFALPVRMPVRLWDAALDAGSGWADQEVGGTASTWCWCPCNDPSAFSPWLLCPPQAGVLTRDTRQKCPFIRFESHKIWWNKS